MLRADAAGARALDRSRLDQRPVMHPQEPLRGRAHHHDVPEVEVRREGGRVHSPQPRVQRERRLAQRRLQPLRQVRLEDVAGVDVLDGAGDRLEVGRAREVGAHAGEVGDWVGRGG